ncbi:MAG TPA: M20/M25/M40 family metallo-hydrolase [Puia sp.]|nr:M20/M25/M40 family metallo-hydrolase [Puia sp.]
MRIVFGVFLFLSLRLFGQRPGSGEGPDTLFNASAVGAIENVLASDAMRGRASFTPDIERAADYIESQFREAGLKTWNGSASYRQPFSMIRAKLDSVSGEIDGTRLTKENTIVMSSQPHLRVDNASGYRKVYIKAGEDLFSKVLGYTHGNANYLVLVDTSFSTHFARLGRITGQQFKSAYSSIFILTAADPVRYRVSADQQIKESPLANVVGILPGTGPDRDQYVIFSGHYDHLGVRKPDARGDSIYNGANDDASGTTAVILLAKYFAQLHNNKRTLVFAAFTAEEIGEFGSQHFSSQFDPDKVVAMFNIEMIGSPSKWGDNSAFVTGFERSSMSTIMQHNLAGSKFTFYPDPYKTQNLFYRSDNASLARKGVPAHTISTTQIDIDKTYHTPEDEVSTIDLKNMAEIIKAIALSSTSIVQGEDTPTRVDKSQVR